MKKVHIKSAIPIYIAAALWLIVGLLFPTFLMRLSGLLITAALLHDVGKLREIAPFPENDYTDEGQLLGHIYMGALMVSEKAAGINGFPDELSRELQHCILAHHGELEYGSPKKPALIEALVLSFADNLDAKVETFIEQLENNDRKGWLGYCKLLDSNIRRT
jgi:3'-5' exoribonuclease